jgi:CheY-like chemotaxis protein
MSTILVIEDERLFRQSIHEILRLEGFDVLEAEDGQQGLALAREHLPDLILCDIWMPKLDGYGVLEELRKHPDTAAIPFVYMTARASESDVALAKHLGLEHYLIKPFDIPHFLNVVRSELAR